MVTISTLMLVCASLFGYHLTQEPKYTRYSKPYRNFISFVHTSEKPFSQNKLPDYIQTAISLSSWRCQLKVYCFCNAYIAPLSPWSILCQIPMSCRCLLAGHVWSFEEIHKPQKPHIWFQYQSHLLK